MATEITTNHLREKMFGDETFRNANPQTRLWIAGSRLQEATEDMVSDHSSERKERVLVAIQVVRECLEEFDLKSQLVPSQMMGSGMRHYDWEKLPQSARE